MQPHKVGHLSSSIDLTHTILKLNVIVKFVRVIALKITKHDYNSFKSLGEYNSCHGFTNSVRPPLSIYRPLIDAYFRSKKKDFSNTR